MLEDWKVLLDGGELAEIRGVAPPGYAMAAQVTRGVRGSLLNDDVAVVGANSLFASKRFVRFSAEEDRILEFRGRWGNMSVLDGSGGLLARKRALAWEMPDGDMRIFGATAIVEMAGLEHILRNSILSAF
ncbi:hypothetical protein ABZY81_03420 [Streptomyces sp. NPDC006514]|uniref:hypothetical protein n=1 Tax=Streptomyces sp. NPDC006514 TaxID=3154308 RepID=UPI0033A070AD